MKRRILLPVLLAVASVFLTAATGGAAVAHSVVVHHTGARGELTAVDCPSPNHCVSVGHLGAGGVSGGLVVFQPGKGKPLKSVTIPKPVGGVGVACISSRSCEAVFAGYTNGFAASIAGTKIGAHRPLPFGPTGIACPNKQICYVVGGTNSGKLTVGAITELKKGKPVHTWHVRSIDVLNGISCISVKTCVAVGQSKGNAGVAVTLVRGKPGTPHAAPSADATAFYGVVCGTGPACDVVGQNFGTSGQEGVVAYYDGKSITNITNDTDFQVLSGIDCHTGIGCEMTGSSHGQAGFANLTNGIVSAATIVRHSEASTAFGESCVSGTCVAAGFWQKTAKSQLLPALLSLKI